MLLIIVISIAQAGDSYPGFGDAVTYNITETSEIKHFITNKHTYFLGAGLSMGYLLNCCVLLVCYVLGDTKTQFSKYVRTLRFADTDARKAHRGFCA